MTNNDIFKKLRVALQLRDDQIVEILELVDFRISKGEVGNFFRNADHPKYMDCGDQILRNFLNGLVIYLRGTKEAPKNAMEVLEANQKQIKKNTLSKKNELSKPFSNKPNKPKHTAHKSNKPKSDNPFIGIKFNNGKQKKSE